MPIYKRCSTCHQLFTGPRCPECKKKSDRASYKRRVEKNERLKLYHSRLWEKCRRNIIIKYLGLDIWLLAEGEERVPEKIVIHHIVERDENPDLLYDVDNLVTVSPESHAAIHAMYKTNKPAALERIRAGIEKFNELFGDP